MNQRQSDHSPASPIHLLIVDDDATYATYIATLARRLGIVPKIAPDGAAAIRRLTIGNFDMLVIDHDMPRLNGMETIAVIRSDVRLRPLYAMMLTSRTDLATKIRALDSGFDDFLAKSGTEGELLARLASARRLATRYRDSNAAARELYNLATRDELTGVFNRRFFISETEKLIERAVPLSIVLLDLDDFKDINDTRGHLAGDMVLRDVGTTIHINTRAEDVVGRLGGDEFIVAVPGLDPVQAEQVAQRLVTSAEALRWESQPDLTIHISAGIGSSHLLQDVTLTKLISVADRDMYKNKWLRKHPEERPELYEYPSTQEDRLIARLTDLRRSG